MRILLILAAFAAAYPCLSKVGLYLLLDLRQRRQKPDPGSGTGRRWRRALMFRAREIGVTYASLGHGALHRLSRARRLTAVRPQSHPERPPILLVHGYGMSAGQLRPLTRWLEKVIARDGWCLDWGSLTTDLERAVPRLAALAARAAAAHPGQRLDIVAHSLGGLLVARALPRMEEAGVRVGTFLAVATPFHGTEPGAWSVGPGRRWLQPGSRCLSELRAELAARLGADLTIICLYSLDDEMIQPAHSCRLSWPGAFNVPVLDIGHHDLLFHPAGRREIARLLMGASAESRRPR